MRFWLLIIFFYSILHFNAQGGFRVRPYIPGALNNTSKAIFETTPGNYIAAGLNSDTLNGTQISRLTIMGLGFNGQMLWHKSYGNDKWIYLNNSLIRRSFYKQGNFLYHACCVSDSNGKMNGVLVKMNLNGDTVWQKIYRDSTGIIPQMVTGSVDGGFLITGYFFTGYRCLLIKTDANGNELWRKKLTGNVQDGRAIRQDTATKKIVVAGCHSSSENILIFDSLGTFLTEVTYNAVGGVLADLIQTKDKKFVAVGQKIYPQTLGGYNLIKSFAVKFDVNNPGQAIWKIDGYDQLSLTNNFNCIYELENGDMMIGGDLDTLHIKNINDNYYHRLTKIDKDGNVKWNRLYDYRADTSNAYYQTLISLSPASNGAILASFQLFSHPSPLFFVKYDSTGCDSSSLSYCAALATVGLKDITVDKTKFKIYPNPAEDFLNIETNSAEETESDSYRISFTDIYGREVKRIRLEQKNKIDLGDLSKGIYLLLISKNNKTFYKTKLIKE